MRSQSDMDTFSQPFASAGREYQSLVYEQSCPHKTWNIRPTFNMDLNINTGYNNQEYTNAGGKVYVG